MRILGLDYGSRTVGVAVSDPFGWTAQGLEIIRREKENVLRKTCARIQELVTEYQVTEIFLGYPVMLSGDEGERVEKTKLFKETLEKRTGLPVIFRDERLTTVAANEAMEQAGIRIGLDKDGDAKPNTCIQCGKCMKVCEAGAITQNAKGVYMINKKLCTGCGKCAEVCPMQVMVKGETTTKCIACGICAKVCPMGILEVQEK